jgi:hypothetical protein
VIAFSKLLVYFWLIGLIDMNKNMMALLNESLASMIGDVKKIGVFLFVAALTLSVLPAEAGSLPLSAGTYYCTRHRQALIVPVKSIGVRLGTTFDPWLRLAC